jgi:shikimate kinase
LQVENPEQKLRDLLTLRDPLYREVAHYIIETNQGAARDLAQKILHLIMAQEADLI